MAGRAGRDRWATAGVGVRDDAVVEVGRPQLEAITRSRVRSEGEPLTVLYAPTWEGWTDEDFSTSLTHMGPPLVRGLLDASPAVRVIYKPHPFTGIRDKRATRSHEAIVALIEGANASSLAPAGGLELADLERRLGAPGLRPDEAARLGAQWSQAFWAGQPAENHVVVDGARPTIVDCFNHADVLVSDVSSVVTDFIASGKPYVCANPEGDAGPPVRRGEPERRRGVPPRPGLHGAPGDPRGPAWGRPEGGRPAGRPDYLLGPDEPPSIVRWRAAVETLAATVVDGPSAGDDEDLRGDVDDEDDDAPDMTAADDVMGLSGA